ncbi:MAG: DUF4317 domain-containing protein [Eubacteriales bacterium]|nr:DUF4317 domain-containing protein [Eubacteriales bacterium]
MNKKELSEIKKQYTKERCPATRICGCYVDGEKNKQTMFREAFLSLEEEAFFKYLNIFRKVMSGTIGKNLVTMEFPLETEQEGGTQEFLMKLKYSGLQDDGVLEEFYDKVIASYDYTGNYLILLLHAAYDVPGKSSDNLEMFDASDEVYEHVLCAICPVNLSKPCLSYNQLENCFENHIQDWLVEMPQTGFLFPAFHDRSSDIHAVLCYHQKPEAPALSLVNEVLGCTLPMTAGGQKESFELLVEETLGEECSFEAVRTLHETLNEMIEEQKEEPDPLMLGSGEVRRLLEQTGASNEKIEAFDQHFEEVVGEQNTEFVAANVAHTRKFEIKTPEVVIQVNPDRADLVETREIDGRRYLMIEVTDEVEVNGIQVKFSENVANISET